LLWSIAKNLSCVDEELIAINRLSSSNIYAGQILEVPGQNQISNTNVSLYRVKSGDYLSVIAQKFGTTLDAIYQTNKLHSDILMPGQPLFIPKGREAVQVEGPVGLKKAGKGEFLPWNWARWVYNPGTTGNSY
jgi:LysM repeat protein